MLSTKIDLTIRLIASILIVVNQFQLIGFFLQVLVAGPVHQMITATRISAIGASIIKPLFSYPASYMNCGITL